MVDATFVQLVFEKSQSGPWPKPFLTPEQLLELSELCFQNHRYIHTAEAFAVSPGADRLKLEFSLLEDPPGGSAPSQEERAQISRTEIAELVERVRTQAFDIRFEVWLD